MRVLAAPTALRLLATGVAAVTLGSWALVAAVHANDTFHVTHVSGAWLGLAWYVDHGVLYPPLFDGDAFGGTRFMPLQILVYAAAAPTLGGSVLGAKLIVYTIALLLLGGVFAVARIVSGSTVLALGLLAVLLSSGTGLWAATAVSGDALPVLLQLAAVVLVARAPERRPAMPVLVAGLLCALAVLTKLTALWAPAAILLWLLRRDRRRAAAFLAVLGAVVLLGALLFSLLSDGRLLENVVGLSGADSLSPAAVLADALEKLVELAHSSALPIVVLAPLVLADVLIALSTRTTTLFHLSFLCSIPILLVVLADPGTDFNHLLDISVLGVILVADLWRRAAGRSGRRGLLPATIMLALVLSVLLGYRQELGHEALAAAKSATGRDRAETFALRPPAAEIRPSDAILSEDPYVPLSLDRRPVVLDAFMLLRLARAHPEWEAELISRIDARAYDKVLLIRRARPDRWWERNHFGTRIVMAIARNYRLARPRPGWRGLWLYVPRG